MGLLDRFRSWLDEWPAGVSDPAAVVPLGQGGPPVSYFSPNVSHLYGGLEATTVGDLTATTYLRDVASMSVAQMWMTQPHLRTVVSFLARNVAQLGVHVFERVDDLDRVRDRTSPLARALARPNDYMTTYELIYALVGDLALYDAAYWFVQRTVDGGVELHRLPPSWVSVDPATAFTVRQYRVVNGDGRVVIPASDVLAFTGYHPVDPRVGSPTVESLRAVLQEQIEAVRYREQVWKRGGRASAVITRPAGAPEWSPAAIEQFREDWLAQYTGNGPRAGGTPVLSDGMKLERIDYSAHDQEWAEGARLALAQVAAAFHVNPAMLGDSGGISYANVREFRRMLYGETLGPTIRQIEERLSGFLAEMVGAPEGVYAEFNVAEKLRGSFEEQAAVLQTSTGGPWMTRNEARARQNLRQVDGGDELIVPLNLGSVGDERSAEDLQKLTNAVGTLIRSGYDPADALAAVGLDPIKHLGLLPVTVQRPEEPENVDQQIVDQLQ